MGNSNFMNVLNRINKLMEEPASFFFMDSLILNNVVKELSILHKLHHK